MFENIIPNLVSFDTKLRKINGFYFSDNFNFYPEIEAKSAFHYKIFIDDNITIPKQYDFRSGYFFKFENKWYYERKIGIFTLKFCFDPQNKTFSFNKLYSLIPIEVGHIFPVGKHIADFINLDLFLEGYIVIRGCAFNYKGNNFCVLGPGMNGKTTLVKDVLEKGGKYIAEDIMIFNFKKNKAYPTSNVSNFRRFSNKEINFMLNKKKVISSSVDINKIFLIQNSTSNNCKFINKGIFDYLNLLSLAFLKNHIIGSYICESKLTDEVFNRIDKLRLLNIAYKFKVISNFNFNVLLNNK